MAKEQHTDEVDVTTEHDWLEIISFDKNEPTYTCKCGLVGTYETMTEHIDYWTERMILKNPQILKFAAEILNTRENEPAQDHHQIHKDMLDVIEFAKNRGLKLVINGWVSFDGSGGITGVQIPQEQKYEEHVGKFYKQ